MIFRYFKSGDVVERVLAVNAAPYEAEAEKWTESTFKDWWDTSVAEDTKAKSLDGAAQGEFWSEIMDPVTNEYEKIACSLETGEPIEDRAGSSSEQ